MSDEYLIDFSKAFDVVRHRTLLSKLSKLGIPPPIHNWIIPFLTDCSQLCKTSVDRVSVLLSITRSIIQGSGLGPTLWLVMASDLHPLSDVNIIVKYADDVNFLVPENTSSCMTNLLIFNSGLTRIAWYLTSVRPKKWSFTDHIPVSFVSLHR